MDSSTIVAIATVAWSALSFMLHLHLALSYVSCLRPVLPCPALHSVLIITATIFRYLEDDENKH